MLWVDVRSFSLLRFVVLMLVLLVLVSLFVVSLCGWLIVLLYVVFALSF